MRKAVLGWKILEFEILAPLLEGFGPPPPGKFPSYAKLGQGCRKCGGRGGCQKQWKIILFFKFSLQKITFSAVLRVLYLLYHLR